MGGLEESTGEGAAKVGGNASLTGASNDMYVYIYIYIYIFGSVFVI